MCSNSKIYFKGGTFLLKSIDIDSFGCFKDYKWCNSLRHESGFFKKNNIIYGENYSGKTTLSRIIDSLGRKEVHQDYIDHAKYTFYLMDGTSIDERNVSNNNYKVSVYNSDFVSENLKWFMAEDGELRPLAIIGETGVDIDNKITQCDDRLEKEDGTYSSVLERYQKATNDFNSFKKRIKDLLTDRAREIRHNFELYGEHNYTRSNLKEDLDGILHNDFEPLTLEVKEKYKKLIKEENKETINYDKLKIPEIQLPIDEINKMLTKEISVTNTIEKWVNDTQLSSWIEDAYRIHKDKYHECQFCGGPLEELIFTKVEQHFSKESEWLKNKLKKLIKNLESTVEIIGSHTIDVELFLTNFHTDLERFIQKSTKEKYELKKQVEEIIARLYARLESPFKPLSEINLDIEIELKIYMLNHKLKEYIQNHNEIVKDFSNTQKELRNTLRLNKVYETYKKFLPEDDDSYISYEETLYDRLALKKEMEWRKRVFNNKEDRIRRIKTKKEELQQKLKQEQIAVEQINDYLNYFFQTEEIELVYEETEDAAYFKVTRNSKLARNLSEGERRIISFCYFLTSIHDGLKENASKDDLIIYIDDPISSLDKNHIFTMFSIINSLIVRNGNYNQLFVSTHNLEFLKYMNRIDAENVGYYQVLRRRRDRDNSFTSILTRMQKHLKNNVTEFHYLFKEMKDTYDTLNIYTELENNKRIENAYTSFFDLPNIIRRFLEIYLFYKYPNENSLYRKIMLFFDSEINGTFVNRIINEFSHTTTFERANKPPEIPEVKECLDLIFKRMENLDEEQYKQLKDSIA